MRERWLGATGRKVPEIAVEGELDLPADALVLVGALDPGELAKAHAAGQPVIVRAAAASDVRDALAHPEVACVLVPKEHRDLLDLDLTELTYG